ncbi:F-box only protein 15 isoform X3 [Ictalurus furcatus]|uniref:F-box only protein 15 isoform X3 n=1 Tax=Ictalurus furcatus TaxID=66913 RepID=UPI0023507ADF|nr:F-box only protein 15 isoform X3 [Ictalurus furcatus]XP_053503054.1 F-box only protein 15 isoform X3 [Ictalurus furcatus]
MATGRGQFLLSLRQGLERIQPGRHGGNSGRNQKEKPARDGRSSRRDDSTKPPPPPPQVVCCPAQSWSQPLPSSLCGENYFKSLPPEIILKIFSYLDAASLFCVGFVNRQFRDLADDNMMWYELYSYEMGRRKWRPRLCETPDSVSADMQDVPAAVWKRLLFRKMGCHKDAVWKKELRHVNLSTGMPQQTEQVLRSLRVVWEITLIYRRGKQSMSKHSQAFFSDSSVTVCWSDGVFPKIHNVISMQLHGVLGSPTTTPAKPRWRSLICKTLVRRVDKWRHIGTDRLVKLFQFDEGITVGVWRGTWVIAFIMATLHFHRLVERSVLGSLFCPYRPEETSLLQTDVLPGISVPGYTVLMQLHNSVRRIMQCRYSPVLCTRDDLHSEFVQLRPVKSRTSQKHTPILGKISFPWKAGELHGDVKSCCSRERINTFQPIRIQDSSALWCITYFCLHQIHLHSKG